MSKLLRRVLVDMAHRADNGRKAPAVVFVHPFEFWNFVRETSAKVEIQIRRRTRVRHR